MLSTFRTRLVVLMRRRRGGNAARIRAACMSRPAAFEALEQRSLMSFTVTPTVETDPVPHSGDAADDSAVWVHPSDTSQSTIVGSDKDGGLAVYDLAGKQLQYVSIGEVNNVDLRYGFPLGGQEVDLVVASNRSADVLAVYRIDPATRTLENVAARPLSSNLGEVYGLAMYKSATSGKFYAYVSDRNDGRVEQWELFDNGAGRVDGRIVRTFDAGGTVEGMVADDETGAFYAGEESGGLWKYGAEPDAGTARTLIDTTDTGGRLTADLEGLAIYYAADGGGYLLASNQGANEFMIYDRRTSAFIDRFQVVSGTIDGVNDTDGIDVSSAALGPLFPEGVFVAQDYSNSGANQNFKLVRWGDIARRSPTPLLIDTSQDPRGGSGTPVAPPAAPSGLTATAVSATRVNLAWSDNSDNEDGFRVERSTDGISWTRLATAGGATYVDGSAPANSTLRYRVLAVNAAGDSDPSNVATAVTPLAAPSAPTPLAPSTPVGVAQNFTVTYSDPGGWQNLNQVFFRVNADLPWMLDAILHVPSNRLYLRNTTTGALTGGFLAGSDNVISNGNGTLNCADVTVTKSAADLTVNWSLTVTDPKLAGPNRLFVRARGAAGGDTRYVEHPGAAWTVSGNAAPTLVGVAPPTATETAGAFRDFAATYDDPNGAGNLNFLYLSLNESDPARRLRVVYNVLNNRLYLLADDNVTFLGGFAPGSQNVISNARGSLNCAATNVGQSGTRLVINWNLSTSSALGGANTVWLRARDRGGLDTFFRQMSGAAAQAPAAPSALKATAVSPTRIDLSWAYNSSDEAGFVVERSTDGGAGWSVLSSVSAGVAAFSDTGLTPGTTYEYRVSATNSAGTSAYTDGASATTPADTDNVVYSGPLVITAGGTYTGNWESLDPSVPAVSIRTTEPVVIENANVRGRYELIRAHSGADVIVRNTSGYGLNPNVYGQTNGRFFYAEQPKNVVLVNNYLESTGGIKVLEYGGDYTAANTIRIVGNRALNIDGRKSDGAGGYLDFNERTRVSDGVTETGYKIRQFVQLDKVQGVPGIEIAWNEVVNEPGGSRVEDNINIYRSGGTAESPILIHDNYVKGAYNVKPWESSYSDGTWNYDWGYAGGGILLGDGSSGVAHVKAYGNTVVSTTNYGIAIAAGHDTEFYDNRVLSSGRLPDGRWIAEQNVGVYIWDLYGTGSAFYNNSARDNVVGWVKEPDGTRNDWWIPDASSFVNNTRWAGELAPATEAAELALWRSKAAAAGVDVGAAAAPAVL